jgi:hypothetical protein
MRNLILVVLVVISSGFAAAGAARQQQGGEQYAGVWSGSWEGSGSGGGFELTLDKPKDGAIAGRVSVTGEPTYKAELKSVTFDAAKMTARYDFPPDDSLEVVITGTFDGKNVTGGWSVRQKGTADEVVNGSWKASRQQAVSPSAHP